jgi:hypothetical protein
VVDNVTAILNSNDVDVLMDDLRKALRKTNEQPSKIKAVQDQAGFCRACKEAIADEPGFECPICMQCYHAKVKCLRKMFAKRTNIVPEDFKFDKNEVGSRIFSTEAQKLNFCGQCLGLTKEGLCCKNCKRMLCETCVRNGINSFLPVTRKEVVKSVKQFPKEK